MAFKDTLLHLSSYPESTPTTVIEQAVALAAEWGAHVTALTFDVEIPSTSNVLANALLDIPGIVVAERRKSIANAQSLVSRTEGIATDKSVPHHCVVESSTPSLLAAIVTEHAKMHDVAIIPIGDIAGLQQYVAQSVIFGSGRPTILLPEAPSIRRPASLEAVGVAWDFSRSAARAVHDAIPILQRAKVVRIVTITHEKAQETSRSGSELVRHLAHHGIDAVLDEEGAAGRKIGQALGEYAVGHNLDLLVMGAFGHSRLRDFVLGGATLGILANPTLPVMLSH